MKNLDELISFFCGNDELRPVFMTPFNRGGVVYSTDAHILVKVNQNLLQRDYCTDSKTPKTESFFTSNYTHKLIIKDIQLFIDKAKKVNEIIKEDSMVECDECDGYGLVTWEYKMYDKKFYCPKCDGESKICITKSKKLDNLVFAPKQVIGIGLFQFSVEQLNKILKIAQFYQCNDFDFLIYNKQLNFKIGEIEGVLMSVLGSDKDIEVIGNIHQNKELIK